MTSKAFDIVVYGATGYTGQLIIEYLNQQYGNGNDVTWAIAGRNKGKLEAVRDSSGLAADTPLVVADFTDEASMQAMVDSAKTIISTVGPYQLYGELLISLCAATGTDYVDLCGEPTWMRQMIDRYNAKAQASGARIVFSCGIDSIHQIWVFIVYKNWPKKKQGIHASMLSVAYVAWWVAFRGARQPH